MELWYTLNLEIKVGETEAFLALFRTVSEASRKEPGVLQYDLLQNSKNLQQFNLIQRYASPEAIQHHMSQPYTQKGMALMSEYLAKPYAQTDYLLSV